MSADALNADSQLDFTQAIRRRLVKGLLPDDESASLPDDPKLLNVLLAALKDHDKVTLTLKRLDADNENADADRAALDQFHRLSAMTGAKDLARTDTPTVNEDGPQFDPSEIPTVALVEGELATGLDNMDYDKFMAEQSKKHKDSLA
jgi:hypothetical protein